MEYQQREYPFFSACGLNCGLCPRHQTAGASKCPGCAGSGFSAKHPSCGVLSCSQRHKVEYCYLCEEFPCKKYDGADQTDSFITHRHQFKDLEKARQLGIKAYAEELNQKMKLLAILLQEYDDGRHKSFFCLAVNLLQWQEIQAVVGQLAAETRPEHAPKEKAATATRLLENVAAKRNIELRLRKKQK